MNFKTDFVLEDYTGLCWFQAKKISIVLSLLLAIAFAATAFGITSNIIITAVVGVITLPLSFVLQRRNIIKRAERRYAAFGASDELFLTINDDEIFQVANSGETRLPWADVYCVRESDTSYYVFLTKRKAFYFPKRSFSSEEQREEFLSYIKKYVAPERIKLKK